MSTSRPMPPAHAVPTLTEVVSWPEPPATDAEATGVERPASGEFTAALASTLPMASAPAMPLPLAVQVPRPVPSSPAIAAPVPVPHSMGAASAPAVTEEQLAQRVLVELQHQVDLMLDVRLRESMAPILARATDALVRDVRNQLTSTLRDVVTKAVAQELARHKPR